MIINVIKQLNHTYNFKPLEFKVLITYYNRRRIWTLRKNYFPWR